MILFAVTKNPIETVLLATRQDRSRVYGPNLGQLHSIWPGLMLAASIAGAAFALRQVPGMGVFGPMMLAILIGITFHNLIGTPVRCKAGIAFSLRHILRFAIILLGLQLTLSQVSEVGMKGVAVIGLTLVATIFFTIWLGQLLGVERKLAELIAAGTSICGASAVVATGIATQADEEDIAYAIACVTVFGSIAMFSYPLLSGLLHLDSYGYGLWAGASIHEMAQVVIAAFQVGELAGDFGTIAKLTRVIMLAPIVFALGYASTRLAHGNGNVHVHSKTSIPWFVFGFITLVGVNSLVTVPPEAKVIIIAVTTFLLTMSVAAMGLATDIIKLQAKGMRPFILGLAAFFFISSFSLMLVKLIQ